MVPLIENRQAASVEAESERPRTAPDVHFRSWATAIHSNVSLQQSVAMPAPRHLLNPTGRFSNRAQAYHESRPSLPAPVIDVLLSGMDRSHCTIADLGAGTGLSSLALADAISGDSRIVAVEPNADMRAHAHMHPRIQWLAAAAEATGLPDASVDLALSVTAFHWFDPGRAPSEIARILRPGGRLAVVATDRDPADAATNELHCLMGETEAGISPANIHQWYGHAFTPPLPAGYSRPELITCINPQAFDLPRLIARAQSSSYWPIDDSAQRLARESLTRFHKHHADSMGILHITYSTIALAATRLG
jgi:SAM-dependent methyltransferase